MPLVIPAQPPQLAIGVDFSPDGRWLATSHFDGHVGLWRDSGELAAFWRAHEDRTRASFTPDSGALISGSGIDPERSVWSVPEARRLGTLPGSEQTSRTDIDARLINLWQRLWRQTPDPAAPGGWVIDDRAVRLCERLAEGRLRAGALSPDGSQAVYAIDDALYLAPVAEPSAPTLLGRGPSTVELVEFNTEGDRLATAHADGTLRLWSLHDGTAEPLRDWPRDLDGMCDDIGFDPSGALLAAAFDTGTAVVRAVAEPPGADPLLLSPLGRRMTHLAFHPDGRWLATASLEQISLWPLERVGHPTVLRGHSGNVDELVFAPDGSWLASIGVDGTVRRWPLQFSRGAWPSVLDDWGHAFEGGMGSIAMSPDGRFVVATASETTARVVPVDGSSPQSLGGFDQRVLTAAVGPGGRLVAVPGRSAGRIVVRVWDLETGAVSDLDLTDPRDWLAFRVSVEFGGDGRLLVAHQGQLMRVDPATGRREMLAGDVGRFALGRRGTVVLSRRQSESRPMTATVHDLVAGTHTPLPRHGPGVSCVALDPSGTIAVTGSWDGVVRVGPVTGEEPHWLVGHESMVRTVAVSPDGRLIASGGRDGTIRLWPMPDLSKPPLQALPRAELIARLKSLTNLRVVRNPEDPENYVVRADPFPGWLAVPEW
jgi:WD40 repeat protein